MEKKYIVQVSIENIKADDYQDIMKQANKFVDDLHHQYKDKVAAGDNVTTIDYKKILHTKVRLLLDDGTNKTKR